MTREDREIWEDLDDDERLEAYAASIDECNKLRRVLAVYGSVGCGCRMTETRDHDPGCVIGAVLANDKLTGQQKPEKGKAL
jgi:hypothetical protein